jgi:hypothetical protein
VERKRQQHRASRQKGKTVHFTGPAFPCEDIRYVGERCLRPGRLSEPREQEFINVLKKNETLIKEFF